MCFNLKSISDLNIPNCVSLYQTFYNCRKLKNINIANTNNVTNCYNTFSGCCNLESDFDLDLSNNRNLNSTFAVCRFVNSIILRNCEKVTSLYGTFNGCRQATKLHIYAETNVSTSYGLLFQSCFNCKDIQFPLPTQLNTSFVSLFNGGYALT